MKKIDPNNLPVLTGTKVRLRPITFADTDYIVKWRNTQSVRVNFIFREQFTAQMHNNWMRSKVMTGQVVQYMIEDLQRGQPIGSVYFRDVDYHNQSAEYGIFIGEEGSRGKGLGSETARLFVDFGLNTLGLHRICLRVLSGNDSAYRSYEKAGFVKEGIFRDMVKLDGQFRDVIFMAVIAK